MAAILNSANSFLHKTLTQTNSIWLKLLHCHSTWWRQPSWIQPFSAHFAKKKLHSFTLTQLDDHLEFCQLDDSAHQKHLSYSHSLSLWLWIKLIQSDSNHSFAPKLMMTAILNSANLNSTLLDSAILFFLWNSLTLANIDSYHFAKKNFTHSFWLNLMMAILMMALWLKVIQSD